MFHDILVPVDGSADSWVALHEALHMARQEGGVIHGLYVIDIRLTEAPYLITRYGDNTVSHTNPEDIQVALKIGRRLGEKGDQILSQVTEKCLDAGVLVQTEQVNGRVSQTILERARQADLIVMGHHGEGARWAGPMLGSTFEAVVRYSPVPILVTQAEMRPTTRLLVAYDGSERSNDSLEIAARLAAENNLPIVLLTVDDGHPDRQQALQEAKDKLRQENRVFTPLFWKGHPAEEILQAARTNACDLIVMGAYGHGYFLEFFFGSTVDEVMRGATCPVLICR